MKTGALILAAGASSISKAEILNAELDTLRQARISPIVVVTGHKEEEIRRSLAHRKVQFVNNLQFETTTMFDSIRLGLTKMQGTCDKVLIVNGDTPSFSVETVCRLAEMEEDIVFPSYNGMTGHPICLNMAKIDIVLAYEGSDGIRGMIRSDLLQPVSVPVEDPGILMEADEEDSLLEVFRYQREGICANPIRVTLQLGLARTDTFFDSQLADLLEEIDGCGSLNMACKSLGMAYSRGWKMLKAAEEMLGYQLVMKQTGGSGGGGSGLTDQGQACLCSYRRLEGKLMEIAEEGLQDFLNIEGKE